MHQFPPKCPCLLISRTCEYVTLHDKRDFEGVIMIVDLEWRDYPGLSCWAHSSHRSQKERCYEKRVKGMQMRIQLAAAFENEGWGHQPRLSTL